MLKFQVRRRPNAASPSPPPPSEGTASVDVTRSFYDNYPTPPEPADSGLGSTSVSSIASAPSTLSLCSSGWRDSEEFVAPRRQRRAKCYHRTVISLKDDKSTGDHVTHTASTASSPVGLVNQSTVVKVSDNAENVAPTLPARVVRGVPPPVPAKPPRQMFSKTLQNFEANKPQRLALAARDTIPGLSLTVATPPSPRPDRNLITESLVDDPESDSKASTSAESLSPPPPAAFTRRADGGKHSLALPSGWPASLTNDRLSLLSAGRRSNSLGSLSSVDSGESSGDLYHLRVFTGSVRAETDYVTLKIRAEATAREIVARLLSKFRLSSRDENLFQLWMEIRTRAYNGRDEISVLELDNEAHPLELQRCQPIDRSRFVLAMATDAVLLRIFDGEICPQSNYKSLLISRRTTCAEALLLLLRVCRLLPARDDALTSAPPRSRRNSTVSTADDDGDLDAQRCLDEYGLFIELNDGSVAGTPVPVGCALAEIYLRLAPCQRLALRRRNS